MYSNFYKALKELLKENVYIDDDRALMAYNADPVLISLITINITNWKSQIFSHNLSTPILAVDSNNIRIHKLVKTFCGSKTLYLVSVFGDKKDITTRYTTFTYNGEEIHVIVILLGDTEEQTLEGVLHSAEVYREHILPFTNKDLIIPYLICIRFFMYINSITVEDGELYSDCNIDSLIRASNSFYNSGNTCRIPNIIENLTPEILEYTCVKLYNVGIENILDNNILTILRCDATSIELCLDYPDLAKYLQNRSVLKQYAHQLVHNNTTEGIDE